MYTTSHENNSFEEHNERMKRFRQMHPPDLKAKVSRQNPIDTWWLLFLSDTISETGESDSLVTSVSWSALFPVHRVTAYRFSPN